MKKITHIIITTAFALVMIFGAHQTFAQENTLNLQAKMAELRETHADLKAQVEAGTLTKEEAREQWKEIISEARAEKEAFFEEKMKKINAKYEELLKKNPERAALLKERIDSANKRREEAQEKREELRAKVESGEITKAEARQAKIDFVKTQRDAYTATREDIKERGTELREERKLELEQKRIERQGNRPVPVFSNTQAVN